MIFHAAKKRVAAAGSDLHQSVFDRKPHEVGAAAQRELDQNVSAVGFDGVLADVQFAGDFGVGGSVAHAAVSRLGFGSHSLFAPQANFAFHCTVWRRPVIWMNSRLLMPAPAPTWLSQYILGIHLKFSS